MSSNGLCMLQTVFSRTIPRLGIYVQLTVVLHATFSHFPVTAWSDLNSNNHAQGVDVAYLQTGISGVFFWVLNFENLYFFGVLVTADVFFLVVK